MKLRELINRLEKLSKNGRNDDLYVVLKSGPNWQYYPEITSAWISQDPDFDIDEADCGPEQWVELDVEHFV